MHRILIYVILAVSLISCRKDYLEVMPENIHEIESINTGQAYEIKVLLPKNYSENQNYKVVYLVDGYYHFDYLRSEFTKKDYLNDVILVGIFYRDYPLNISPNSENSSVGTLVNNSGKISELRTLDLTYPENPDGDGGKGNLFTEFFRSELIPLIEQTYSTDSDNRTIMGHSFGGYFAMLHMFAFNQDPLFKNIISLDTQIWWADLFLLEKEEDFFQNGIKLPFKFYMGAAKLSNLDTNTLINEFHERLVAHNYPELDYRMERYNDGHSYSAKNGFHLGLKYIFND